MHPRAYPLFAASGLDLPLLGADLSLHRPIAHFAWATLPSLAAYVSLGQIKKERVNTKPTYNYQFRLFSEQDQPFDHTLRQHTQSLTSTLPKYFLIIFFCVSYNSFFFQLRISKKLPRHIFNFWFVTFHYDYIS